MTKGDLILVPFPFTDLTGSKLRPALVLIAGRDDVTVAFLTTQLRWTEPCDIVIEPTKENGLKQRSLIRLSKLATIDAELVAGILGEIGEQLLSDVDSNLKIILKIAD
jgi:mRNA interferase MazF